MKETITRILCDNPRGKPHLAELQGEVMYADGQRTKFDSYRRHAKNMVDLHAIEGLQSIAIVAIPQGSIDAKVEQQPKARQRRPKPAKNQCVCNYIAANGTGLAAHQRHCQVYQEQVGKSAPASA